MTKYYSHQILSHEYYPTNTMPTKYYSTKYYPTKYYPTKYYPTKYYSTKYYSHQILSHEYYPTITMPTKYYSHKILFHQILFPHNTIPPNTIPTKYYSTEYYPSEYYTSEQLLTNLFERWVNFWNPLEKSINSMAASIGIRYHIWICFVYHLSVIWICYICVYRVEKIQYVSQPFPIRSSIETEAAILLIDFSRGFTVYWLTTGLDTINNVKSLPISIIAWMLKYTQIWIYVSMINPLRVYSGWGSKNSIFINILALKN